MSTATKAPKITMHDVERESKAIAQHGYDAATQTLRLRFANSADLHDYTPVPRRVYNDMLRAPSIGGFHATVIRGQFERSIVPREDKHVETRTGAALRPGTAWPFPTGAKP
jgi:hypothetical protein